VKVSTPIKTDSGDVNEAVASVTWTATGAGVAVGDFQQFAVSVGLPDVAATLLFPTAQTYSNRQVVNWVEQTPPGGPEPDNPAPHITLTAGSEGGGSTPTTAATAAPVLPKNIATTSDVDSAKTVGYVAIAVGVVGLIVAIIALVLGRRRPGASG
jgi:periplasmic copper chaperone A